IEEANSRSLTFLANPKYEHFIYETEAGIIVINDDLVLQKPVKSTLIRVKNAYSAFTQLLKLYDEMRNEIQGINEQVYIHESSKLGEDIYVGAFSYIGRNVEIGNKVKIHPQVYIGDDVKIGDHVTVFPGVKIYKDCVIGNWVTIHAGAVVGGDGFGF